MIDATASATPKDKLPGVRQLSDATDASLLDKIRQACRSLCEWERSTFPGSQPVSLSRRNLTLLHRHEYVACEKSDGERHLFYLDETGAYIVDRMFRVYRVHLVGNYPVHRSDASGSRSMGSTNPSSTTLLDGELIEDVVTRDDGSTAKKARYLIYDAMCVAGVSVVRRNLLERLRLAYKQFLVPYLESAAKFLETKSLSVASSEKAKASFEIYVKDFFDVRDSSFATAISQYMSHESDGLIFTPVSLPYTPGTCSSLLKWKPSDMNTVDFALELLYGPASNDVHVKLLAAESGIQKFSNMWLSKSGPSWDWILKNQKFVNNKVAECRWDPEAITFVPNDKRQFTMEGASELGGWIFLRMREDRTTPNDMRVMQRVRDSINDGITHEKLMEFLKSAPGVRNVDKSASSIIAVCDVKVK